MTAASILTPLVAPLARRALAFIDMNRTSATYGCADRPYWYYRTLTNFSGSTWQSVMLGLAALHKLTPDAELLEDAGAALGWWAKIAHRDGAFDEWYLNEHSYCPTAITGAHAALTLDLLGEELAQAKREAGLQALRLAGAWLTDRYNPVVMNQNLAAVVALAGLAKLDGGDWKAKAEAKLAKVKADQSTEGWLPEYSGADLGYSTLALDLLAAAHRLGIEQAADMGRSLAKFLVQAQGGWTSLGGRIGSRGTSHGFPFGALHFGADDANGARLAGDLLAGLESGAAPRPAEIDDRYFAYFYFPQFALALHAASGAQAQPAPIADGIGDLPASGFLGVRRNGWSALISRRLGGALALSGGDRAPLYHLGYEIDTANGRFSSVNWDEAAVSAPLANDVVTASSVFRASSSGLPLKTLMAPFQLAVGFLGNSSMAESFQGLIKDRMVAPKASPGLQLNRTITLTAEGLRLRDELKPLPGLPQVRRLDVARTISMHSPSARQDRGRIIEPSEARLAFAAAALNGGRTDVLVYTIDASSGAVKLEDER